jgi:hypothetical protein
MNRFFSIFLILISFTSFAQNSKPKSYIINKQDFYTIDVKNNKASIELFSEERKWVGDKDDNLIRGNKIDYSNTFEEVFDIESYSISPEKKKEKVRYIQTADREIENIFYHDIKYKFYEFYNLKDGSETYSSFKKTYKVPQLLDTYFFKDNLDCKDSKLSLKVSKDIEIGYVLHGNDIDDVKFSTKKEGDYTIYSWQLVNSSKEEFFDQAPPLSYYSPHLIFFIKKYKNDIGYNTVLGSVDDLYKYYFKTIKDINKTDQSDLKRTTEEIIKEAKTETEKAKAIFDFVQTKIQYVAFEDGMGGFIPREASDVFKKKYGDCKDMANLLNEMLHFAKIESYIAWIGTRHNNYTYEKVPTPIVDNHMIAVAKINNQFIFLDATGQYTIFPNSTPFIQGKQALLKIDENNYKILPVPLVPAEENMTEGKIQFHFEENKLVGNSIFNLKGFTKTQFVASYKNSIQKEAMLKEYLSRFIVNFNATTIDVKNDDLSQNPLEIKNTFELDKWIKKVDNQILFKPILFFPNSNFLIDTEKRNVPVKFDFNKSSNFEYIITIPEGYKLEYKPEDFKLSNNLISSSISYVVKNNQIIVSQQMKTNILLLEKEQFNEWNLAIKSITKQYNQNIIFTK